jgi:hypothetical protein
MGIIAGTRPYLGAPPARQAETMGRASPPGAIKGFDKKRVSL